MRFISVLLAICSLAAFMVAAAGGLLGVFAPGWLVAIFSFSIATLIASWMTSQET